MQNRTRLTGLLFFFFMQGINIEIKAKASNIQRMRQILCELGAEFRGADKQTDTYFRVSNGRLKLREGNIENNLIHYSRNDQSGPKLSRVFLFPVTKDVSSLKTIMDESCGVLIEVRKLREIYYIDNIKFHLDQVDGLGEFVEIEVFGMPGEQEVLLNSCKQYMRLLGISRKNLVKESYSDMLLGMR
jgi:adenylate cyclase, class 2